MTMARTIAMGQKVSRNIYRTVNIFCHQIPLMIRLIVIPLNYLWLLNINKYSYIYTGFALWAGDQRFLRLVSDHLSLAFCLFVEGSCRNVRAVQVAKKGYLSEGQWHMPNKTDALGAQVHCFIINAC